MTARQCRIKFTERYLDLDCLGSLIKGSAIGRSKIGVGDRAVKISLRLAIDECLDAGRSCGRAEKELISPVRNAEGVFVCWT